MEHEDPVQHQQQFPYITPWLESQGGCFLWDQTLLFLTSVIILWLPQTDYESTYISHTGSPMVTLKSYFYYYLHLQSYW